MSKHAESLFKIMIIGKQGVGKTTIGRALAKETGAAFFSTSTFLAWYLNWRGKTELTMRQILRDKENHRQDLIDIGDDVCANNPAMMLAFGCFKAECAKKRGIIYDGVRRIEEFKAIKNAFSEIIHIERPGYKSVEDNFELEPCNLKTFHHQIINNAKSKAGAEQIAKRFFQRSLRPYRIGDD